MGRRAFRPRARRARATQGAGQAPQAGAPAAPGAGARDKCSSPRPPRSSRRKTWTFIRLDGGFNVARGKIPHGEVKVVEYDSKTLGLRRMMRVYTPPGYGADRKYPVLYVLHGLGNTSTEWTQRASAPIISTTCWPTGKLAAIHHGLPQRECGRDGGRRKAGGPCPRGLRESISEDMLKEIIPFVESHYSVLADRNHRASPDVDGRGQTLNIGLTNVDKFAWIA